MGVTVYMNWEWSGYLNFHFQCHCSLNYCSRQSTSSLLVVWAPMSKQEAMGYPKKMVWRTLQLFFLSALNVASLPLKQDVVCLCHKS